MAVMDADHRRPVGRQKFRVRDGLFGRIRPSPMPPLQRLGPGPTATSWQVSFSTRHGPAQVAPNSDGPGFRSWIFASTEPTNYPFSLA